MSPGSGNPQPERLHKAEERILILRNFETNTDFKKFLFSSFLCFMNIAGATLGGGSKSRER